MKINIVYPKLKKGERKFPKKRNKALMFIRMLEDDETFEREVESIRKKLNITNFPKQMTLNESHLRLPKDLLMEVIDICDEFGISDSTWTFPFATLILYNKLYFPRFYGAFMLMDGDEIYDMVTKSSLWQFTEDEIFILIDRYIEKTKFLKEMEYLHETYINKMEKWRKPEVPEIKLKKLDLYKEIYDLKNRSQSIKSLKRGKFVKIADILNERHGTYYDDVDIRVMYDRYQKALFNLHSNVSKK